MAAPDWPPAGPLAVLAGGGLDSGVLLAEAARGADRVFPLYVRTGAVWEGAELHALRRLLAAIPTPALAPLAVLEQPVRDLYGDHWSLSGSGVPDAASADAAVYLPGRNVLLLAKPLLWCHLRGVPALATAPLAGNPFPDATPAFYDGYATAVAAAVGGSPVKVLRPFADLGLHKADVVRRGAAAGVPLHLTFSCLRPAGERPCGGCNKCAERRAGFAAAGVRDPTDYAGA